jgi:signal peptidase I
MITTDLMQHETQFVFTADAGRPRKNSIWLAFALSIFTPGLGQLYNGQPIRCILFYALCICLQLIGSYSGLLNTFAGTAVFLMLAFTWRLYIIAQAMLAAREEIPKEKILPRWPVLVAVGAGMFLIAAFFPWKELSGHQSFSISSTANEPACFVDETVTASTTYFDDHEPDYGDLIVYEGVDGLSYTYRVAGLPGDQFQLQDDVPAIDGVRNATAYLRDTLVFEGRAEIHLETLPNGKSHEIILLATKFEGAIVNTEAMMIPEGYLFVLGDNRDNALDSRYTGLIPRASLSGKCLYVLWSRRLGRIGTSLEL